MHTHYHLLAIESSCDDMAAAVVRVNPATASRTVLSHAAFSQIALHQAYGGVVPDIASRSHVEQVAPIVKKALADARLTVDQIDLFAATSKPGLAGSLLIGFSYAKTLAWALNKPFIPVNHLEGHVFSSFITSTGEISKPIPFPHIALSASGGHSGIYYVTDYGVMREIGNTRDDAAGEAFDKIAKLIGLEYPGGPIIERLAGHEGFVDFYRYPRTKTVPGEYMFSFSGLKTAVLYDLVSRGHITLENQRPTPTLTLAIQREVASSLLVCVGDIFAKMASRLLRDFPEVEALTFVGGVACNAYLCERLRVVAREQGRLFFSSEKKYSTDNGAMIGNVAAYKLLQRGYENLPRMADADIFE